MEADLDELQLDLGALLDRRRRREVGAPPLGEHLEVVGVDVPLGGNEVEPASRRVLDRREPRAARTGEERERPRVERDAVRLDARAGAGDRERAELPLDLERVRRVRDDDAVAGAGRALRGS